MINSIAWIFAKETETEVKKIPFIAVTIIIAETIDTTNSHLFTV